MTLKPLDETTVDSVREVVLDRFGPAAYDLLRRMLSNPVRKEGEDIGFVVDDGESVAGVTGSIVRRLYFGKEPFVGICGGVLAMRKNASPALLFPLMKKAHHPRFGSVLFYSNTCSSATLKMKPCVGVKNVGPDTWNRVRFARLRRFPLLHRTISPFACAMECRCLALDRVHGLTVTARPDFGWADDFFARYLERNEGIVGSRTTAELEWAFGEMLKCGQGVTLVAESREGIVGYIVVGACSYDAGRWLVCDALAIGNERNVLALLFDAARQAVLKCSTASTLSVIGFPSWLEDTLAVAFPRSCATTNNAFVWGFSDAAFAERCSPAMLEEKGWFFGPYDGDYALCRM